jgi:protein-disulfide isomerase
MKIRAALFAVAFGFGLASAAVAAPAPEGTVDMTELLKAAPLPELAMGPENGIPVIEYGSVTCPHCAAFDKTVLPKLKAAYVDTGKVRYIFREFSRNALDVAAFTLARCVGDDKAMATIELLFSTQDKWAFTDNPLEPLLASLRPTGLSRDKAMACLKDNTEINKVRSITETAEKLVKVQGTPTFVIDGKVYGGELSMDDFDQILKPLIK